MMGSSFALPVSHVGIWPADRRQVEVAQGVYVRWSQVGIDVDHRDPGEGEAVPVFEQQEVSRPDMPGGMPADAEAALTGLDPGEDLGLRGRGNEGDMDPAASAAGLKVTGNWRDHILLISPADDNAALSQLSRHQQKQYRLIRSWGVDIDNAFRYVHEAESRFTVECCAEEHDG